MLHIISHYGILCSFNVINIIQGSAQICSPPEGIPDQSGLHQFTVPKQTMAAGEPKPASQPVAVSQSIAASQPVAATQPVLTIPSPQQGLASQSAGMPSFGNFNVPAVPSMPNNNIPTSATSNKPQTMVSIRTIFYLINVTQHNIENYASFTISL